MRKITFIIVLIVVSGYAPAQALTDILSIHNFSIAQVGKDVEISFMAHAGKRSLKSRYTAILTPVVTNGEKEIELTPIVIDGQQAQLSRKREGTDILFPTDSYFMKRGEQIAYSASIPFNTLSPQSQITLKGVISGCCSTQETEIFILASGFVKEERIHIEPLHEIIQPTTGDILASRYSFVSPLSDFERQVEDNRDRFIEKNRQGSITIYFPQAVRTLDPEYRNNRETLLDIGNAIKILDEATDSKISYIVIAGFASPEGTIEINQKLAHDRAIALRDYFLAATGIDPILIDAYNGGVDWYGLRVLVQNSDLPEKAEVLDIIDNIPEWSQRHGQERQNKLKRLNKGTTYNKLLNRFFPELRNACYIRIYYENP